MLQQMFNVLAYGAGLFGQFDPYTGYNLQKLICMIAELLGTSVSIGVG